MAVLVGFVAFGKSLVSKYIDTLIEASAEKNIKKLENRFARSMTAYEILLKKEFDYYSKIDAIYAELIVRIQDCCDEILGEIEKERPMRCEDAREELIYILQSIPVLKNYVLLYQVYIPIDIFKASAAVVDVLQEKTRILHSELKKLFDDNESDIDRNAVEEAKKEIITTLAVVELSINKRLNNLAESK